MSSDNVSLSSDFAFELEVATDLCRIVDSPRALTVLLLIQYSEWDQLLSLEIDPAEYVDHDSFADDYLVTKVLSKSVCVPASFDKAGEALKKFYEGEELCRETNDRISSGRVDSFLGEVSYHLGSILGALTTRDLQFVADRARNGPGATFAMAGTGSVPSDKMRASPTLTYDLIPFARSIMGDRFADLHGGGQVVEGNRFTTVPKTAKTDRGICIEPSLNVFLQLGIGALLRNRLSAVGINLNDQSINQRFAESALSKGYATIDLSLASDSVSLLLVERLLTPRWFELLRLCRSPATKLPSGRFHDLEKFSSMGNGYTFELESLIFAGICLAAGAQLGEDCHVYGDDIIVKREIAPTVLEKLEALGFRPNRSKTFLAGRFFESCGTDWFDSMPVRPFFLRKQTSGAKSSIPYAVQVCNRLRLYARQRGVLGCDSRFREMWLKYYHRVPKAWRHPVPEYIGDCGVIVSDLEHKLDRSGDGHEGHVGKYVLLRPIKRKKFDLPLLLHHLHALNLSQGHGGVKDSLLGNSEIVRGYLGRPRTVPGTLRFSDDLRWV